MAWKQFKTSVKNFANDPETPGRIQNTLNALAPYPNMRLANGATNRDQRIMTWRLPDGASVQMYINPQNFDINESKQINQVRTKGGFIVQYWGDNLTELNLRGTTGSAGIKGINVLRDIYRSENKAFELVAAVQSNELINLLSDSDLSGTDIGQITQLVAKQNRDRNFILRPSLATLALNVLLFYQGVQYKGFFTSFAVSENAAQAGLFDYNIRFVATETRGSRQNFAAWHREPLADDLGGQLINGIGNSIRRAIGLAEQAPMQFGPDNAPYTFGGNSVPASLGFDVNPQSSLIKKTII